MVISGSTDTYYFKFPVIHNFKSVIFLDVTDNYSGLTPNTCYKIKRYFTHKTF